LAAAEGTSGSKGEFAGNGGGSPNPFQRLALVILRLGLRCLRLLQASARGFLQVVAQAVTRLKSG
jgi:hypothetical protein